MTVPAQIPIVAYVGNGVTTVFPFPFRLLAESDLTVTVNGSPSLISYTITGIGNDESTVTFSTAPTLGAKILLFRNVELARDEDYQDNGDLLADTVNADFDRIWMALQGQGYVTGNGNPSLARALLLGLSDTNGLGAYQANTNRISNLGYPKSDNDAATYGAARDLAEKITSGAQGALGTFIQDGPGSVALTFQQKMRDSVGIGDKGPLHADGINDDTTPVNNAIATAPVGGVVNLAGKSMRVTGVDNQYGIEFEGGGELLIAAPQGGVYAQNSYGDRFQRFIGKEYLYRLFLRLQVGGTLTMFIYGDSTAATAANGGGYAGAAFEPQQLITDYMIRVKGVRNPIACVNRAIGGTRVVQMNAIPDIDEVGGTTDVFWIKYGINDIQDGIEGFKDNLRGKLAEIRAQPHGTVDQLSIILVGPNAIYDPQHFRSSQWMEQIRGIYVAAARDFKCAYFDAYGAMRDANWMPGTMLSDDFGNKQGVHPRSIFQNMIWGWLIDEMMGDAEMFPYSSNVWQALTPLNGWAYYGGSTPGYYASMSRDGWVDVRGMMKDGTVGANVKIAQLPASMTPVYTQIFACGSANGPCLLRVNTDGSIDQADTNSSATYTDLSGIRFQIRG